jgi:hypothetical protein
MMDENQRRAIDELAKAFKCCLCFPLDFASNWGPSGKSPFNWKRARIGRFAL